MLIGELDEVDALVPEELSQDEQRFVDVRISQGERRSPQLAPRPIRQLRPYDAIPLAVDAMAATVQIDESPSIDDNAPVPRRRHLIEFEAGEGAF